MKNCWLRSNAGKNWKRSANKAIFGAEPFAVSKSLSKSVKYVAFSGALALRPQVGCKLAFAVAVSSY
jgi:hypothetical protein